MTCAWADNRLNQMPSTCPSRLTVSGSCASGYEPTRDDADSWQRDRAIPSRAMAWAFTSSKPRPARRLDGTASRSART